MLPIYQQLVDHIGSIWLGTGYGDRCSYPHFIRYPREYVADVMYVNVVRTVEIVRVRGKLQLGGGMHPPNPSLG
jgi:hypothetical protein